MLQPWQRDKQPRNGTHYLMGVESMTKVKIPFRQKRPVHLLTGAGPTGCPLEETNKIGSMLETGGKSKLKMN